MSNKLNKFKDYIKNKKVAVLGIGVSNIPLIKYLYGLGVDITAFDKCCKDDLCCVTDQFKGLDIKYSLGDGYLKNLKSFDVIFRTPGMRYDLPEIVAAKEEGAKITSEMEVFFEVCPAQIIAVTGSDGKTTTSTLIYKMLKKQGYNCWLGGNIGTPLLCRIDEIKKTDKVVLELSSFQLQTMTKSPEIAVITNLSPNHLDFHKSMDEYVNAKKNIFIFQSNENKLILNFDNDITREFGKEAKGKVLYFSRLQKPCKGAGINNDCIFYKDGDKEVEVVDTKSITIPGVHNVENYLAAICAVMDYVDVETIQKVAKEFKGVEHRLEFVGEKNGVLFYNDSIASSPTRTIAGLLSFDKKVILIAGGYDKNIPYDKMGAHIAKKAKSLFLIGQTADKIHDSLKDEIKRTGRGKDIYVCKCETLDEAVKKAYNSADCGDIVVMSPASASFDMFKNFDERGKKFKQIVKDIINC